MGGLERALRNQLLCPCLIQRKECALVSQKAASARPQGAPRPQQQAQHTEPCAPFALRRSARAPASSDEREGSQGASCRQQAGGVEQARTCALVATFLREEDGAGARACLPSTLCSPITTLAETPAPSARPACGAIATGVRQTAALVRPTVSAAPGRERQHAVVHLRLLPV